MNRGELIEAAARQLFEIRDDPYDMDEWDDVDSVVREPYICGARAALDAVLPLIAEAIEDGRPHIPPSTDPKRREAIIVRSTRNRIARMVRSATSEAS